MESGVGVGLGSHNLQPLKLYENQIQDKRQKISTINVVRALRGTF